VEVQLSQRAKAFRLWTATSADRDFRDETWSSVELHSDSPKHVLAQVQTPISGFRAYLVEADLVAPDGTPYKLSTEARVTPDGPPSRPSGQKRAQAQGRRIQSQG
jgi:PhoPQ-activated pathogenicity-related protein